MAKKDGSKKSSVPANETKAQKFVRLGNKRVPKALKAIRQIGQLAGSGYESSPEQRKKITDALNAEVKAVTDTFAGTRAKVEGFTL